MSRDCSGVYINHQPIYPRDKPGLESAAVFYKYFITNPDRLALILISSVVSDNTSISPISFELKTYRLYLLIYTPESEICGRWKERKSGSIWLLYLHDIGDFPGCFVTKVRPIDKSFHHGKIKLSHWASSAAISEHNKLLQYWKVKVFSKLDLMQMIGSKYAISHFDLRKSIANVSDTVV